MQTIRWLLPSVLAASACYAQGPSPQYASRSVIARPVGAGVAGDVDPGYSSAPVGNGYSAGPVNGGCANCNGGGGGYGYSGGGFSTGGGYGSAEPGFVGGC